MKESIEYKNEKRKFNKIKFEIPKNRFTQKFILFKIFDAKFNFFMCFFFVRKKINGLQQN